MYSKKVMIKNQSGLHARPAKELVTCAQEYASKITICKAGKEDRTINAKSIVSLLTLSLTQGEDAVITAEGTDEIEAVEALAKLIESGFGE
ncbi:HPr family phosphocarrier protein [Lederbergia sp. NSJ-179]|uniref:HPr family phosphocarrier protein n=1 Tax=Lederbergia sp. NSJ-179 TaxID=2931402 RepID=UPI001FD08F9B|nr:HPr family phosphocarrier protein [Lederbergia sp. NSJ-179]MCJ7843341.1 HPr family phosphocarrier protein [Lederbergia sp. NSJ-179]